MNVRAEVDEAIGVLRALHVAGLGSVGEIEEAVRSAGRVRVWADSVLSSLAARADALSAEEGAGRGGETVLRAAARLSNHASNAASRRAAVASAYPAFGAAFAAGEVTGEHLDVLGRVGSDASAEVLRALTDAEADLLAAARSSSPERFGRQVRGVAELADPKHTGSALEQLEATANLRMWRGGTGCITSPASSARPRARRGPKPSARRPPAWLARNTASPAATAAAPSNCRSQR